MEKTPIPAVFIHGTLGWGRKTPFFNLAPDYWPIQHLDEINPNYIIVEVGIASSDHDRACETFYQLVGGRVDYGKDHAAEKGHLQFGAFFDTALHPQWSEEHPVHLIGHSYGATTALELYQLICTDFFGIGSNYKWVKSIVSISGTLSGTTITPMMGCEVGKPSPFGTVSYIIACGFSTLYKLQLHFPWLNHIYDLRMPQWSSSVSWSTLYNTSYKPLNTDDNVFTCLMPQHRLEKNRSLVHMDKIHLFSIVSQTENALSFPLVEVASVASMLALWKLKQPKVWICLLSLFLWRRLHVTDWSTRSLFLGWLLKRHAETTPILFDGFDKDHWQHSDGIVNSYSMIRPRHSVDEELNDRNSLERVPSHISIDMNHDHSCEIPKGQWHIYRVAKNHLCGTRGDGDARELYLRLFRMLNQLST